MTIAIAAAIARHPSGRMWRKTDDGMRDRITGERVNRIAYPRPLVIGIRRTGK